MKYLNQRMAAQFLKWERKEDFKRMLYDVGFFCPATDAQLWDGAWFDLAALEECLDRLIEGFFYH